MTMSSAEPVQHKERMAKAYKTMKEIFGWRRKSVTPILSELLKLYNNDWHFIEADNYRVLADIYLEAREAVDSFTRPRISSPLPSRTPPPTRAAACHGGNNGGSDGLLSVKREPNSSAPGRAADALVANVAPAVEYQSGPSVRIRAATDHENGSQGIRGCDVVHNLAAAAAAAAAHQRDKGKSPLLSEPLRPQPRGVEGLPDYVTVKLEVSCSLPPPEGFEKAAFERVDSVILPAVKRPQNGAVEPLKQAEQLGPLISQVKVEGQTLYQQSDPNNQILAPFPLLAKDLTTDMSAHIKTEPREEGASPPHNSIVPCEDMSLDQSLHLERSLCRRLSLEESLQPSPGHLQVILYGSVHADCPASTAEQRSTITAGPSIDRAPKVQPEEHERTALPLDRSAGEYGNVLSLVDNEDDDPVETAEQGVSGTGCDLVLVPDKPAEHLEPPELNDEEIRPNFIVSASAKRDMVNEQAAGHPKRQKCKDVAPKAPSSSAPPRRRLILYDSPDDSPDDSPATPMNGDSDGTQFDDCIPFEGSVPGPSTLRTCSSNQLSLHARMKRELIASASPSPERNAVISKDVGPSDGVHTMVRNGGTIGLVADHGEDKVNVSHEARGYRSMNSALKRVRLQPGHEGPNAQQLKHDPEDISRGTERVPIPFINEFTSETIDRKFNYVAKSVVYQNAYINISLARIGDQDCCLDCVGDCSKAPHFCPCTRETGGDFAYTQTGGLKPALVLHELATNQHKIRQDLHFCARGSVCPVERARAKLRPDKCKGHSTRKFIKECWHKCGCHVQCGNRVVQRGISRRLEVFFTNDGRGWGLRTAEDLLLGSFVCEYVGEITTNIELYQRNQEAKKDEACGLSGKRKNTYPVLLDADGYTESGLKDEEALCLDATRYGNVARFINHQCWDPNLINMPVSIEGLDRHYYHVAFFTSRDVQAGEELTWDYGIDFEDNEHPIEAFVCLCKSGRCRSGHARGTGKDKA